MRTGNVGKVTSMNDFQLEWGEGQCAAVYNVSQLHEILDRIELVSKSDPQIVDLTSPKGEVLNIGLGHCQSIVMFSNSLDPPYLVSTGCATGDGTVAFRYHGDWTEFPKHHLIPYNKAREAMEQFFVTGKCPDNVEWVET